MKRPDSGRLDLSKDVSTSHSKGVPPHSSNSLSSDRRGVVLVTVLWIMVGLSLLALTLAATVRTEATLARASGEAEQAYFFARGALEAVLYRLAYPDPDPRKQQALFPYAGGMNHYRLSSRQMRCHLALMDEAGKLDLNAARPETLERLLRIVGASPPRAEALAAAVVAWRTPGPRPGASTSGRRPFRFVEELLQVPGMGRELLYGRPRRQPDGRTVFQRGLMDFLTVYTATNRVNVNYAAPEVLAALPGMGWEEARSLVAARRNQLLEASDLSSRAPAEALPFLTTQPSQTFSLVATAWLEGSATRRSLRVVARRDPRARLGHQRLVWYDQVLALAPGPRLFRPAPLLLPRRPQDFEPACERRPMDLLSPGAFLKQLSLGVAFGPDALHLSLLSSHWERVRRVDAETIDGFQAMPPDRRRRRVQAFLERNRAAHCSVVVSLPRREVLLRQLELPLEARENLAKVVEYQRVHLLPSEEQAVATDTLAVREDSDPPRLRVTLFVVLQSTLDRTLDSCRQLGLSPDRILPGAVALADYLRASLPKAAAAPSLAVQLDPPRGELAGLVQGQLRLCKEFRYDPSNLEEVLESEAELFRGEAGLDEEAPLQLYLAGHGGPLSQSEGRLPFRALPPPAPSGPAHALPRPAAADWPALAAAFCGFKRKGALAVNLLPAALRPRKSRWEWVPTYALAALNALLLLALLLQGPVQQRAWSQRMSRERERLEPAVSAFRKLEAERDLWRERAGLLDRHRNRNPRLLAALAELSRVLPADSVVTLLTLREGQLRIQGTSGQAAALPRILEDSRHFGQVELVSSISRNSKGRETFHLQARLEDPAGPAEPSLPPAGAPDSPREVAP